MNAINKSEDFCVKKMQPGITKEAKYKSVDEIATKIDTAQLNGWHIFIASLTCFKSHDSKSALENLQ